MRSAGSREVSGSRFVDEKNDTTPRKRGKVVWPKEEELLEGKRIFF
jgi:hypothetical protein